MNKTFEIEMVKPIYEFSTVEGVFPALDRKVLQQWIARKLIIEDEEQLYEKRFGRKRLYSGLDMVKIMVIRVLSWQGLFLPTAARLAKLVAERCHERAMGIAKGTDEQIVYFTDNEKGYFKFAVYHSETPPDERKTPLMFGVIQADKIIDEVHWRIYGYLKNAGLL